MTIGLYCPIKCFCPFRANKLQGIIPQGDALSYVQTLPFQGAIRPPTYSKVIWYMQALSLWTSFGHQPPEANDGLKAQKLIAKGNALGNWRHRLSP